MVFREARTQASTAYNKDETMMSGLSRLVIVLVTAVVAYCLTQRFVFPGYIALPIPYHPDMYWSVDFVTRGLNFVGFLTSPRPLFYEALLLAGHFGLVGSLLFLDTIVLIDLALAIVLLERLILHRTIPWLIVLGTLMWAMAGPGFYRQPGYDVGFHIALLCGLLGVYVCETHTKKNAIATLGLTGILFVLSALANEGLIPAIVIYCIVAAFRNRASPALALTLAVLPLVVVAAAFGDSQLTHSPFIKMNARGAYPYKIDLSAPSLFLCARFYLSSLLNAGFLVFLTVTGAGLWLRRRLKIGVALLVAALSLYIPYCVLPNHLDIAYQWVPMPVLMLLFPLAWLGAADAPRISTKMNVAVRFALALSLLFALGFQATQYLAPKRWTEVALAQNRAVVSALHSLNPQISASRAVLLCGLEFGRWPFMESALFLSRELNFRGEWSVATEPGFPPIENQSDARAITYGRIRWSDYDLVILFNRDGRFIGDYTKDQFRTKIRRLPVGLSNRGLVDLLQSYYPPGVKPPSSWKAGAQQGLYLDTAPDLCCFLNGSPSLALDKPRRDRIVIFTFEVPRIAVFAARPEHVEILFNGVKTGALLKLSAGIHKVSFTLSQNQAKIAQLTADMRMSIVYVPKQLGLNDDTRQLSIKLLRVDYKP